MKKISIDTTRIAKKKCLNEYPSDVSDNLSKALNKISNFQNGEDKSFNLENLFKIQEGLNDVIFFEKDLRAGDGTLLSVKKLQNFANNRAASATSDSVVWMQRFIKAMKDEVRELEESLVWKWWSNDRADMKNANVEIADILFFWICIAQSAGLTAKDVYSLYMQKAITNIERQFGNYTTKNKTEDDNEEISVNDETKREEV